MKDRRKRKMISRRDRSFARTLRQIRSLPTATSLPTGARVWGELRG